LTDRPAAIPTLPALNYQSPRDVQNRTPLQIETFMETAPDVIGADGGPEG
jgi:hypothetical protein